MKIETERLIITEFEASMAESVHLNSLDADNRCFLPDEVFETVEIAEETIEFLMSVYKTGEGPLVYPVLLKDGTNIGYVQIVPMTDGKSEVGYHIAKAFTGRGYAAEAVIAFLPGIMKRLDIKEMLGICVAENIASIKVLEKAGFIKVFEGMGTYQNEKRRICRYIYRLE